MVRKARFRGSWYPFTKEENEAITGKLDSYGSVKIAVLPHAGLIFSGKLIQPFFENIPQGTKRAIILSPSHYYYIQPNTIITSDFTAAETPFGEVASTKLECSNAITCNQIVAAEHGIEMFLPFIGKKELSVSFGIISSLRTAEDAAIIANLIAPILDDSTVLIASSDFTHYGKRFEYTPYKEDALEKTVESDRRCASLLAENRGTEAYKTFSASTICGIASASIASEIARIKEYIGTVGKNDTSASLTGDEVDFVSYQSVFWRK